MLTDDEKQRILEEERCRLEIRTKLESQQSPRGGRLVRFLNSNFGLWLLSALFISGLSGVIAWYKEYLAESHRIKDRIERLDIEISYRLSQQVGLLDIEYQDIQGGKPISQPAPSSQDYLDMSLTNQSSSQLLSLYPEFAGLSVSGLMAELRRYLDAPSRSEVDEALLTLTNGTLTRGAENNPKIVAGRIFGKVLRVRKEWAAAKFPYTDCSMEMPFC